MSSAITRRLLPRMLAQVSRQHYRSIASSALACEQTQAQQATQQQSQQFYNVPAGHINSDLCNTVCHIGLGRLRDLTLRQDLQLVTAQNGGACTLAQLFKGKKVVLVGLPDLGSVCATTHLPGYTEKLSDLHNIGIQDVYFVSVDAPARLAAWAKDKGVSSIPGLADEHGGFTRALGLEASAETGRSHRYAALVDNGILRRLKVESNPAVVEHTSAAEMIKCIKELYHQ